LQRLSVAESPLTQGRGLKSITEKKCFLNILVAPHAGAWIEMPLQLLLDCFLNVAPHAGAWIEMWEFLLLAKYHSSPLTQGRGLKWFEKYVYLGLVCRPSRRGVD